MLLCYRLVAKLAVWCLAGSGTVYQSLFTENCLLCLETKLMRRARLNQNINVAVWNTKTMSGKRLKNSTEMSGTAS